MPESGVGRYDNPLGQGHGFVFDGTNFTSVDVPGATLTVIKGINLAGNIVGYSAHAAGKSHGFLLSGGQFTTIDYSNSPYPPVRGSTATARLLASTTTPQGEFTGSS